jgi:hypothetical protein
VAGRGRGHSRLTSTSHKIRDHPGKYWIGSDAVFVGNVGDAELVEEHIVSKSRKSLRCLKNGYLPS